MARGPLTRVDLPRPRKRKGKCAEAWKMDLERDEERTSIPRGVNLNAIEQITDEVERMMFSWNMDTFERGQKMLEALPPASCSEEQSAMKVDSKLHIPSMNGRRFMSPLVGHGPTRPRVIEVSGQAPIMIDRMLGAGSVLEIRRMDPPGSFQISTCEKNVGTERAQAEYSSTLWGLTPSQPPTPPDSCPVHVSGSPRKDDARPCSARGSETGVVLAGCESRRSSGLPDYVSRLSPRQAAALLEVGGRPVTMPVLRSSCDALQNKFESLIHMASLQGKELRSSSVPPPEISSTEDLQLALIECATEYEIQTLDARMKVLRAFKRQTQASSESDSQDNRSRDEMATCKRSEPKCAQQQARRDVMRPDDQMKGIVKRSSDIQPWKQKERSSPELRKSEIGVREFSGLFDRQRRTLDDALNRVDRLQREVVRKDRELVEWQLKEKESKARFLELEDKLKRERVLHVSPKQYPEPRKLLIELPALRDPCRSSLKELLQEEQKQVSSPPQAQAESALELADVKSQSDMGVDRECPLHGTGKVQENLGERGPSEVDDLKVTMSQLAANMADLSTAFKDHVQFVNQRLGAIHGQLVTQQPQQQRKRPPSVTASRKSPELLGQRTYGDQRSALMQLKLAGLDAVEAQRLFCRSPRPSPTPSWQR